MRYKPAKNKEKENYTENITMMENVLIIMHFVLINNARGKEVEARFSI